MRSPVNNTIGKFGSTNAKSVGLQRKVASHSVRETCISSLRDSDVSDGFVAPLSGHRSLESLDAHNPLRVSINGERPLHRAAQTATPSQLEPCHYLSRRFCEYCCRIH